MKKFCIILGIIASIIAVILSVLPLSNLAYFPAIIAIILGVIAFYISKKENSSTKTITLLFLLAIIAISLAAYKSIFSTSEVGNTEELIEREIKSEESAIEELEDLDLEDLDIDDSDLEEINEEIEIEEIENIEVDEDVINELEGLEIE